MIVIDEFTNIVQDAVCKILTSDTKYNEDIIYYILQTAIDLDIDIEMRLAMHIFMDVCIQTNNINDEISKLIIILKNKILDSYIIKYNYLHSSPNTIIMYSQTLEGTFTSKNEKRDS